MQAALPMGNNKITGLATPTVSTDAATKAYVDTVPLVDQSVTLQKLYHPSGASKLLGSDAAAALSITGAANNGSGAIRLTVGSTATFATGQVKTVAGVVGTTEANGTWTITVVDATHIDLQSSTFTNVYVSGGTIGGGVAEISLGAGLSMSGQTLTANPASAQNYLSGLTLSTAGGSSIMSIAAGVANDSTNTSFMTLTATSKTTASWAVGLGNGGLDTGAIAANTSYHFYVIMRPDTGVVDVIFSLSASSPTLPTNYTLYRRIGSMKTVAGSVWTAFTQIGDEFLLPTMVAPAQSSNHTSALLKAMEVPTGIIVTARIRVNLQPAGSAIYLLVSSPFETDQAPQSGTAVSSIAAPASGIASVELGVLTDTSGQVRFRATGATGVYAYATFGWNDRRGK